MRMIVGMGIAMLLCHAAAAQDLKQESFLKSLGLPTESLITKALNDPGNPEAQAAVLSMPSE